MKSESVSSQVEIKSQEKVTTESEGKVEQSEKISRESTGKSIIQEASQNISIKEEKMSHESKKDDSISMTLPISRETREKSAEDKLEELDSKMKFVKMIRGTNVERE